MILFGLNEYDRKIAVRLNGVEVCENSIDIIRNISYKDLLCDRFYSVSTDSEYVIIKMLSVKFAREHDVCVVKFKLNENSSETFEYKWVLDSIRNHSEDYIDLNEEEWYSSIY